VTIRKFLFFACLAAVTVVSLLPAASLPDPGISDKLSHVVAYGVLSLLGLAAYPPPGGPPGARMVIGLICYGALMEPLQTLSPGRTMDGADILANGVGVLAGTLCSLAAAAIRRAGCRRRTI